MWTCSSRCCTDLKLVFLFKLIITLMFHSWVFAQKQNTFDLSPWCFIFSALFICVMDLKDRVFKRRWSKEKRTQRRRENLQLWADSVIQWFTDVLSLYWPFNKNRKSATVVCLQRPQETGTRRKTVASWKQCNLIMVTSRCAYGYSYKSPTNDKACIKLGHFNQIKIAFSPNSQLVYILIYTIWQDNWTAAWSLQ